MKKNKIIYKEIKAGSIINIKYLLLKEDEIKILNFIGLCIYKKKNNSILLKNLIKRESVSLLIKLDSPLIIKISIIKKYKKKFRLSKLYYKK
jgi:ribosomal protein L19